MLAGTQLPQQPIRELCLFFGITFLITWGIGALAIVWYQQLQHFSTPLFYLAVYAPSISAVMLTQRALGWQGVRALLGTYGHWRARWYWYLIPAVLVPLITTCGVLLQAWQTQQPFQFQISFFSSTLLALPLTLLRDPGPLGEELGFRGYALPRLLTLMNPFAASLVLGAVWALWHLPSFFISGMAQNSMSILGLTAQIVATSCLMTWLYLHTRSVLIAGVLMHAAINVMYTAPFVPTDSDVTFIAPIYVLAALLVVVWSRLWQRR
jgi:uncharacterized protein